MSTKLTVLALVSGSFGGHSVESVQSGYVALLKEVGDIYYFVHNDNVYTVKLAGPGVKVPRGARVKKINNRTYFMTQLTSVEGGLVKQLIDCEIKL